MHNPVRLTCGVAALASVLASAGLAGAPARKTTPAAKGGFELTVDSIMRGPKLVGYPPAGLRWSGDSTRLYFEWRRPQDEETATWVAGKDGGDGSREEDGMALAGHLLAAAVPAGQ